MPQSAMDPLMHGPDGKMQMMPMGCSMDKGGWMQEAPDHCYMDKERMVPDPMVCGPPGQGSPTAVVDDDATTADVNKAIDQVCI